VLFIHNSSSSARPLQPLGAPGNEQHAWVASPASCPHGTVAGCVALAAFNAGAVAKQVVVPLSELGLLRSNATGATGVRLCARNLWTRRPLVPSAALDKFAPKARALRAAGRPALQWRAC
jgi:hypothetical protein